MSRSFYSAVGGAFLGLAAQKVWDLYRGAGAKDSLTLLFIFAAVAGAFFVRARRTSGP